MSPNDIVRKNVTLTRRFIDAVLERFDTLSEGVEELGRKELQMPPRPDVAERGRFKAGENARTRKKEQR